MGSPTSLYLCDESWRGVGEENFRVDMWELENSYEIIIRLTKKQKKFNMVAQQRSKDNITKVIVDCTV